MSRRDTWASWFPVLLKYTGLGMTVAQGIFWALTALLTGKGVYEPAMLLAFGSMYGVGEGADALRDLSTSKPTPADLCPKPPVISDSSSPCTEET